MSVSTIKRKYKKPSIIEAIFEAKFDLNGFDSTAPGVIFSQIQSSYPHKQDIAHEFFYLERGETKESKPAPVIQAPKVRARNKDNTELVQFGPGVITANRLAYTTWDEFKPAIEKITKAYLDIVQPNTLTRVATRYVNKFLLPEDTAKVSDYFTLILDAPKDLLPLNGFNLAISKTITNGSVFILKIRLYTSALGPEENGTKFILDLDCFTTLNDKPDENKIITLATKSHEIVGNAFESILTDKTRQLLEPIQ